MNQYEKRHQNDIDGLRALHTFGWLRAHELGQLLWPNSRASKLQADRLIRSWLARKLVIARQLPDACGRAIVLAARGVRLLSETGIHAFTGKDLGQFEGERWVPPVDWKHHLLTIGALLKLSGDSTFIVPEARIKREVFGLVKVPDALFIDGETVFWVETEWSKKDGKPMANLGKALALVGDGDAPKITGHKATKVLLIYRNDAKDSRGYKVNHKAKVTARVAEYVKQGVEVWWVDCEVNRTLTVESVVVHKDVIQSKKALAVLRRLEAWKWHEAKDGGSMWSNYGDHVARIARDEDYGWVYQVGDEDGDWFGASSLEEAKLFCAETIAKLSTSG